MMLVSVTNLRGDIAFQDQKRSWEMSNNLLLMLVDDLKSHENTHLQAIAHISVMLIKAHCAWPFV